MKYIWDLFLKQNSKCKLTGLDITFNINQRNRTLQTASIDRIDSSKGYIKGNIQIIHKIINVMKNDLDQDEFLTWCYYIYNNSINKNFIPKKELSKLCFYKS